MSDTGNQAPGWYYAQGDPPGTQRYWDGSQWQGGPQPVPTAGGVAYGTVGGRTAATAGSRFLAYLIDAGIVFVGYIVVLILAGIFGSVSDTLGGIVVVLGFLGVIGFAIYNLFWLQGTTGQSIGKKQQNITLLNTKNGEPVGALMAFVRSLLQSVFAIPCYLDHWWILVDQDNRRLSDKVLDFHVYNA